MLIKEIDKLVEEKVSDYVKSQARNKIIFFKEEIISNESLDIGLALAEAISNFKEVRKLPSRAILELEKILNSSIAKHELWGNYLSIINIGILFEPELKLDFLRLLDNYSQNNVLFVQWLGEVDSDSLFFLTRESGIKLNIKNLSHIVI